LDHAIAHTWQAAGTSFAGVVYGHQRRITIGQMISDLALLATCLQPEEMRDQVVFLPL